MKLWRKLKGYRLYILAGIFTGAEALVTMGVELPGSQAVPQWLRALVIVSIIGAAFVLRLLAQLKAGGGK